MSYSCLLYHIIFSTKERRPLLTDDVRQRLITYIGGIVRAAGGKLLEANGPEDHLHLAVSGTTQLAIANLLRDVKANSSRWIHDTFPEQVSFAWQDGYAVFSVSQSVLPKVVAYIRNQQDHHRKASFEEELFDLLRRHEVTFDENYISA